MIKIIAEGLFIGFYNIIIYFFIHLFTNNLIIQLFLTGFFKHYLGYFTGIQDYYCKINKNNQNYSSKPTNIILESLLEGFLFIYIGFLISLLIKNRYLLFFILGFFIHIIAEFFGIHYLFLLYNCKK